MAAYFAGLWCGELVGVLEVMVSLLLLLLTRGFRSRSGVSMMESVPEPSEPLDEPSWYSVNNKAKLTWYWCIDSSWFSMANKITSINVIEVDKYSYTIRKMEKLWWSIYIFCELKQINWRFNNKQPFHHLDIFADKQNSIEPTYISLYS